MATVAIVFHSGYGHTAKQAQAVAEGVTRVSGVSAKLIPVAEVDTQWETLKAAEAIVFGAPTYMGGPAADFKVFADKSSKPWFGQEWKDKIAGGFTNSASLNGDKHSTIAYFVTLAMQHSMIWVGTGMLPANNSKSQRNDVNRMGAFTGAMAQSDSDVGADVAPPPGDLETAALYGKRIAEVTLRLKG
jgi:NAD(P)H dehydrogenase (quinone)